MRRLGKLWLACLLLAGGVAAAEPPRWSIEVKGGHFYSAEKAWPTFYGDDRLNEYALGVGYKLVRQLEIGLESGYLRDRGKGYAPMHEAIAGEVTYRLTPLHLYANLRGVFDEDQWLVPYLGVAWSRLHYRIDIAGQEGRSGAVDGYQYRAGLQFLLDALEPRAAARFERSYGVKNTYLFVEARETKARHSGVELGGTAYLWGILLEF